MKVTELEPGQQCAREGSETIIMNIDGILYGKKPGDLQSEPLDKSSAEYQLQDWELTKSPKASEKALVNSVSTDGILLSFRMKAIAAYNKLKESKWKQR